MSFRGVLAEIEQGDTDGALRDIRKKKFKITRAHKKDNNGETLLHAAAKRGNAAVVEALINVNSDVNAQTYNGLSATYLAAIQGFGDVVRLLGKANADIDHPNRGRWTPLSAAADAGKDDAVKALIEHQCDLDMPNAADWTPLNGAVNRGYFNIIKLIVEAKADINLPNNNEASPTYISAERGFADILEYLVANNGDINQKEHIGWTPLQIGATRGHVKACESVMKLGGGIDICDNTGSPPIRQAAQEGHLPIVKLLVKAGCKVNLGDRRNITALFIAAENGHLETVKALLTSKAMVDNPKNNGDTPLFSSARSGQVEIVKALVDHKADILGINEDGETPIDIARVKGHAEVYNYLRYRLNRFQAIFSQSDLHSVSVLGSDDIEDRYAASISVTGVEMDVVLKLSKQKGEREWTELGVLKSLDYHKNMLQFLGICLDFRPEQGGAMTSVVVVTATNENLFDYVQNAADLTINNENVIALGMIHGLDAFHKSTFVHTDLHLGSYGITDAGDPLKQRVILSNVARATRGHTGTQNEDDSDGEESEYQTYLAADRTEGGAYADEQKHPHFAWKAPETLSNKTASTLSDVWMLGMAFYELLSRGRRPFWHLTDVQDEEVLKNVIDNFPELPLEFPEGCNTFLRGLVGECCQKDPSKRLSVEEIVQRLEDTAVVETEEKKIDDFVTFEYEDGYKLVDAVTRNDFGTLREMIEQKGVSSNAATRQQWTPLLEAIRLNHVDLVEYLIEHNADVKHMSFGYCPVVLAAQTENLELFDYLIEKKANVHTTNYPTDYHLQTSCCAEQQRYAAELLVDAGIAPTYKIAGKTAMDADHPTISEFIETVDEYGPFETSATMLMRAAYYGKIDVVRKILAYGVDAKLKDGNDKSAMDYAEERNHLKIVTLIKNAKPPPLEVRFFEYSDLRNVQKLSSGNFGVTFRGELIDGGKTIDIVAKVSKAGAGEDEWKELEVLKVVPPHPSVLGLTGLTMDFHHEDNNVAALLVPFMPGGSLRGFIDKHKGDTSVMTAKNLFKFGHDMAVALAHLHDHGYLHRDIALRNFLISHTDINHPDQHLVIADFGLSRPLSLDTRVQKDELIPWRWCAPEVMTRSITNMQTDIYMLGVALWELTGLAKPFWRFGKPKQLLDAMKARHDKGSPPPMEFIWGFPKQFQEIILECCAYVPKKRPRLYSIIERLRDLGDRPEFDRAVSDLARSTHSGGDDDGDMSNYDTAAQIEDVAGDYYQYEGEAAYGAYLEVSEDYNDTGDYQDVGTYEEKDDE